MIGFCPSSLAHIMEFYALSVFSRRNAKSQKKEIFSPNIIFAEKWARVLLTGALDA